MQFKVAAVLRALVAAQVALVEYEEANVMNESEDQAKAALLTCLSAATKLAKKLD